jgi:hypothetical protein
LDLPVALDVAVGERPAEPARVEDGVPPARRDDPWRAALDAGDDRLGGDRRLDALAQRPGDHVLQPLGERVALEALLHHLGVDEAEVGDARCRPVLDELGAQRPAELLDARLGHRIGPDGQPLTNA